MELETTPIRGSGRRSDDRPSCTEPFCVSHRPTCFVGHKRVKCKSRRLSPFSQRPSPELGEAMSSTDWCPTKGLATRFEVFGTRSFYRIFLTSSRK
ncbi:unnamed protein product [Protopolystoma xenopodis]|uniref:Uncharacterized protein n=1 Tax=Protopolystoma xenopodis TaxID=117903 RepID=A0A3S5CIM5_9PLAT|nr:unnamed protein product [Protopolystoma xenopodis]